MSALELYEITRGNWRLNPRWAETAEYGIGLTDGVIRSIYRIQGWEPVAGRNPKRYRFFGYETEAKCGVTFGYSLLHHPNHRVRGPLFYLNC